MKKLLAILLTLSVLTSAVFASATDFTDIQGHWAYDTIDIMVDKGIMNGVSTTSFAPDDIITYGEVLAIATRLVAPEYIEIGAFQELYSEDKLYHWALDYYIAAAKSGIVDDADLNSLYRFTMTVIGTDYKTIYAMNESVTREEMAVMLCAIAEVNGETLTTTKNIGYEIADYNFINSIDEVEKVYSAGLMTGVDSDGTFNPYGYLTRAEVATIFARLMNYIDRVDVVVDAPTDASGNVIDFVSATEIPDENGVVTIYEGKAHSNQAKEGDIVIKEDGTTVVLAYGENGILGEGQGVAADLGLLDSNGRALETNVSFYPGTPMYDSFGNSLNNQTYKINPFTNCGHWSSEISVLLEATKPTYDGTFSCELSSDKNWYWSTSLNVGFWANSFNVSKDSGIAMILEANGLS